MMRIAPIFLTAGLASILALPPIAAAQNDRLARHCVREVVKLCGRDRDKIRPCLREKYTELSDQCRSEILSRVRDRGRVERGALAAVLGCDAESAVNVTRTISYGEHEKQKVDVYSPENTAEKPPLVLFIHGGGWSLGDKQGVATKPDFFTGEGYVFASTGYRLTPEFDVEVQPQDIGAAIAALRDQADTIGFDRDNIVLIGHSAGAHLAALVGTDPQYAGSAFDAVKGVILLDGAGYDIPRNTRMSGQMMRELYSDVFGDEEARQRQLSPATHVGGPDAPNWLVLYVENRFAARMQSENLSRLLNEQGTTSKTVAISGTDHTGINRNIGTPEGTAQTDAISAFLRRVFA